MNNLVYILEELNRLHIEADVAMSKDEWEVITDRIQCLKEEVEEMVKLAL